MGFQFIFILLFCASKSLAAIYGADQRQDISELNPRWQQAAQAVAVSIPSLYLEELDKDNVFHSEFNQRSYWDYTGICKDERFSEQKSIGHCSAFLIHPKLLVTAGHCFLPAGEVKNKVHSYCEHFSFWLGGYNDQVQSIPLLGSIIPKKNLVHCKKVIYAANNEKWKASDNPIDFAIFELDEEVTHIKPLMVTDREVELGESVVTIGHPHGLPAKFSGFSPLIENHGTVLTSFLDTLGGNSGGPAFNEQGEVVGVLIAGHQFDTFYDNANDCDRVNRCTTNGKNCNRGSDLDNSNVLMKSHVWQPYVDAYLNNELANIL